MAASPSDMMYMLEVDVNNCAMQIYVNDFQVFKSAEQGPLYTSFVIGEYLRPGQNRIRFSVWSPTDKLGDKFSKRSYAKFTISSVDRSNPHQQALAGVYFSPTDDIEFNSSSKAVQKVVNSNNHFGVPIGEVVTQYIKDKNFYRLDQIFTVRDNIPTWNWVNSQKLADNSGTGLALPPNLRKALYDAYNEFWLALKKKDIKKIQELYSEMSTESAIASGITPESFFESLAVKEMLEDENLELTPLKFNQLKYYYTLDQKLVVLYGDERPFMYKVKDKEDEYVGLNPRFRFNGKKFIVCR